MPQIHATAVIDERARIADDVVIGPHCIIQGEVTIGPGTRLIGNAYVRGPITIGARNVIYPFVCLGMDPQDRKFDPATDGAGTQIGDDNIIREGVGIHRATGPTPTTVGHHNFLMAYSHVGHDTVMGNHCTLANGALIAGHVQIADHATLSGNAAVHQFCRLGRFSFVSGVVALSQDLPPFCTAHYAKRVGSLNLVGLRRAGLRQHIDPLRRAFRILYCTRLSNAAAVDRIRAELSYDPLCLELADFVATSKRGITAYAASPGGDD